MSVRAHRFPFAVVVHFLLAAAAIVAVLAQSLSAAPQQNLPTKPPMTDLKDAAPWPDTAAIAAAKRTADNRPLFATTDTLVFSLVADFGQVQRDREPDGQKTYPAQLIVTQPNRAETSIPVRIRTRGHSRLKPDFCTFAPLRVE